jgi:hypothetical protein
VRNAVSNVAEGYLTHLDPRRVIEWFDLGGSLQLGDTMSADDVLTHARAVQGLVDLAHEAGTPKTPRRRCSPPAWTSCSRALRHQEDQPQRRARLSRQRHAGAAAARETQLEDEPRIQSGGARRSTTTERGSRVSREAEEGE